MIVTNRVYLSSRSTTIHLIINRIAKCSRNVPDNDKSSVVLHLVADRPVYLKDIVLFSIKPKGHGKLCLSSMETSQRRKCCPEIDEMYLPYWYVSNSIWLSFLHDSLSFICSISTELVVGYRFIFNFDLYSTSRGEWSLPNYVIPKWTIKLKTILITILPTSSQA